MRIPDGLLQDVRHGIRALANSPRFTLIVLLTLALGIGANTAIFSVVNAVLIRPLNTPDGARLVRFYGMYGTQKSATAGSREYARWREQPLIEKVSAHRLDFANLTLDSGAEQIPIGRVSADFFDLFHARVLHGRVFSVDEDRPGGGSVAILSYEFWTTHFGRDGGIVGRTIPLGNVPHLIVGVLASGFDTEQFDPRPDVWVPFQIDPSRVDGGNLFLVTGRLKPQANIAAANAQLMSAAASLVRGGTANSSRTMWAVEPLQDAMVEKARASLRLLLVAAGFVLLLACANVTNLLLVRCDARKAELAIRAAIGASRGRLVRRLLVESIILALAGAALGLGLAKIGIFGIFSLYPEANPFNLLDLGTTIPRIGAAGSAVTLDWRVLTFAFLLSFATSIIFGLLPAFQAGRSDPYAVLKGSGYSGGGHPRRNKWRDVIVGIEITVALMLLIGASLLIRSSLNLHAVDPGFDAHNVLTMRMAVSGTAFDKRAGIARLTQDGIHRIQGLPGVEAASMTCCMPLETVWQLPFIIQGRALQGNFHGFGGWTFISPGYFDAFKIPILRGRDFSDSDDAAAPGVVIINQAMADRFWPNSDPIGQTLLVGRTMRPEYDEDPVRRIIGIAGNVRDTALARPPRPEMYVPVAQVPDGVTALNVRLLPIVWIARTKLEPLSIAASMKDQLRDASGGLPVTRIRSMNDVVRESTATIRFQTWLMAIFSAAALLLAVVGVYGLIAYSVEQRQHEIGVRMALGARPTDIRKAVLGRGVLLTLIGIAAGIAAAFNLSKLISGFLFGITARDPLVFISAPLLLMAIALLAAWLPYRRALQFNPIRLLRHD